jgi:hypothetical protein
MATENKSLVSQIRAETPESPVTIEVMPRRAVMYRLFEPELERLGSNQSSVHLAFFTLCVGVAIGFGTTLLTVDIASARIFAAFVALFAISMIGAAFFGVMAKREHQNAQREIQRIKEGVITK